MDNTLFNELLNLHGAPDGQVLWSSDKIEQMLKPGVRTWVKGARRYCMKIPIVQQGRRDANKFDTHFGEPRYVEKRKAEGPRFYGVIPIRPNDEVRYAPK